MGPRTRKALGSFALIVYLIAYIMLAVQLADALPFNAWAHLAYFVVAGFAWVLPLKPLLTWMMAPGPATQDEG